MYTIDFGHPIGKYKLTCVAASCPDKEHDGHLYCFREWEKKLPPGSIVLTRAFERGWVAYVLVPSSPDDPADVYLPVDDPVRVRAGLFHKPSPVTEEEKEDVERLLRALRDDGVFTTPETCRDMYAMYSFFSKYVADCVKSLLFGREMFVKFVESRLGY